MKNLYLIKEESGFTDTVRELIEAATAEDNDTLVVKLYEGEDIDYDILIDKIFYYDKVICF
ncbi:hypothetical protein ACMCNP_01705 [Candidatus Acidulodesulfobacterium sp. H_13]|uniref:hypothetical protein n=1 Tax=Candidatus Acidulodesulfobacterium sp. H_13 TaxID=3395470 RepID=UPI003AF97A17